MRAVSPSLRSRSVLLYGHATSHTLDDRTQLVMINVSDHHTRVKANAQSGAVAPVMGCLLGSQSGRVVDISNSFEIEYTMPEGKVLINEAFLTRKQEQCEGLGCAVLLVAGGVQQEQQPHRQHAAAECRAQGSS